MKIIKNHIEKFLGGIFTIYSVLIYFFASDEGTRLLLKALGRDYSSDAITLFQQKWVLWFFIGYGVNALSPIIAGKFQVTTTVIKLIPLLLMAVIGTAVGLKSGMLIENFTTVVEEVSTSSALFTAVVATAFAYEGWIVATSINSELKDSKRNLPKALVLGSIVVVSVYILYYIYKLLKLQYSNFLFSVFLHLPLKNTLLFPSNMVYYKYNLKIFVR